MFSNLYGSFNQWRRYRNTVSQLERLSGHELNDLGIVRSDIKFLAKRAVRQG
ncbi:DUF1127 domain-containing protein [Coralliovum pocilloporae]|uniref:DUF1127 domain-containing protein n=1 Tax=Coralliovum pocilloporae TaxID=3066369 RepID=UPI00330775F9